MISPETVTDELPPFLPPVFPANGLFRVFSVVFEHGHSASPKRRRPVFRAIFINVFGILRWRPQRDSNPCFGLESGPMQYVGALVSMTFGRCHPFCHPSVPAPC